MVLVSTRRFEIGAAFFLIAILPVLIVSIRQVRRGAWKHVDASERGERPMLYAIGIGASLVMVGYLYVMVPGSPMIRSTLIVLGVLFLCALALRWVKISLHLLFVAIAATAMVLMRSPLAWIYVPLVPLLAWSRLVLARHTVVEVVLGAVIGAATGYAFFV
jgi:membrane-associated phospholipid phosphatase